MLKSNHPAMLVTAIVAFSFGAAWCSPALLGNPCLQARALNPAILASTQLPGAEIAGDLAGDLASNLLLTCVVEHIVVPIGIAHWNSALHVAFWIGVASQAALLLCATIHQPLPWSLCSVHAGAALVQSFFLTTLGSLVRS